jgi:hypothetical protein
MATIKIETSFGMMTVKDVMIDVDGTHLEEGITVKDEWGELVYEGCMFGTDNITTEDMESLLENNVYQ